MMRRYPYPGLSAYHFSTCLEHADCEVSLPLGRACLLLAPWPVSASETDMVSLDALVFSWLTALSPLDREPTRYISESEDDRRARFHEIAFDVSDIAAEDSDHPAVQRRAAALLVGIAWHESGFALDVDVGPCASARLQVGGCDSGRAKGLWQIQGYDVPTRRDGARLALRLARRSLSACRKLPVPERLAAYAGGTCESLGGRKRSCELWAVVRRLLDRGEST